MIRDIKKLMIDLMMIQSDSGTEMEVGISEYIFNWLSQREYFIKNPAQVCLEPVIGDLYKRNNVWALLKGKTDKTTILIHHHDAVEIFEYEKLMEIAFDSEALKKAFSTKSLEKDVMIDLNDPEWLFGRGSCDMKAGASIQMHVLDKLSKSDDFQDNILLLSVCDEENLSAGMRSATKILKDLKETYGLQYKAVINSEPTYRTAEGKGVVFTGTVGKTMPVIYVRGKKSHIGQVYSGLNPMGILSQIHNNIELNPAYCDVYNGEVTPAPTWVYMRDNKKVYDVSLPESGGAYFSLLTLTKTMEEMIEQLTVDCEKGFSQSIERYKTCIETINKVSGKPIHGLEIENRVITYKALIELLIKNNGPTCVEEITCFEKEMLQQVNRGEKTIQDATLEIIEKAVSYLDDMEPLVVIGFAGPLYPHLSNHQLEIPYTESFIDIINNKSRSWGFEYEEMHYFMGICDFSYSSLLLSTQDIELIQGNVIGWGTLYEIPFENLKGVKIPMINIGPWGKDLHKITERVYMPDVTENVPMLMEEFIRKMNRF